MPYTARTKIPSPRKRFNKRIMFLCISAVLVAAVTVSVLEFTNTTYWFHQRATKIIVTAGHPAPKPTNNTSSNSGQPPKQPTSNSGNTIGGGTDTNGQSAATTSPSQWIVAKSGNISVHQPLADTTLQNGGILSGTAKVDTVNFRLIDDTTGVISEGTLNVVNGSFSGALHFTPHASTGRLDVFSTDTNGAEINEIQITIHF